MMTDAPEFATILLAVDGPVGVITLNRPDRRNAWTLTLARELPEALAWCDAADTVRAVVVTGAGQDFCVGADLEDRTVMAPGGPDEPTGLPQIMPPDMCKPVIAAMNGNSVGAGITFPLQCDVRIVAEDAKVGFPFVRRGVITEMSGAWLASRLAGSTVALDLILTGRNISGTEAAALGLCTRAVPADRVLQEAMALAHDIAVNTAPTAVSAAKRLLWESLESDRAHASAREMQLFRWLAGRPDATEGVASFMDKRPPAWVGLPSDPLPAVSELDG